VARGIEAAQGAYGAGDFEECVRLCRTLVNSNPRDAQALRWLGMALWNLGKRKESVEFMQKAARSDPQNPQIQSLLAVSYNALGNDEKAERHFERAYVWPRRARPIWSLCRRPWWETAIRCWP